MHLVGCGSKNDTSGDSQLEHWSCRLLSSRMYGSERTSERIEEVTNPIRIDYRALFQQVGDGFGAVQDDKVFCE